MRLFLIPRMNVPDTPNGAFLRPRAAVPDAPPERAHLSELSTGCCSITHCALGDLRTKPVSEPFRIVDQG